MIPISDNLKTRRSPKVCYLLIGINIALFLWSLKLELNGQLEPFIKNWGIIPQEMSTGFTSVLTGNPAALVIVFWRFITLLTSMFLHGSFSQIVGNLIFLWVFGKTLESFFGHGKFLAFYLITGIWTGLIQMVVEPTLAVPLVGANGAIAGIIGAYISRFPKAKIYSVLPLAIIFIPVQIPVIFYSFWWFGQQYFYWIGTLYIPGGVNSGTTAYWMHGAGLIIGIMAMKISQRR
jgi:membrane associated rhomboid family serine protease